MLKKSIQEKLQRLPKTPTIKDLQHFMAAAATDAKSRFIYIWKTTDKNGSDLMLNVKFVPSSGLYEWRMYTGFEPDKRELWFHITNDPYRVYSLVASASGEEEDPGFETFTSIPAINSSKERIRPVDLLNDTFDPDALREIMGSKQILKGSLALVGMTNVVQTVSMGNMTGRLRIQRSTAFADIFFEEGKAIHAEGTRGFGEDCFLQAICWTNGDFSFEPNLKTAETSIKRSVDNLIMEGSLLHDHTDYLKNAGILMTSVLTKSSPNTTEAEFENIASKGEIHDLAPLKALYLRIDGRKALEDIIVELKLVRSLWVPLLTNLLKLKLVSTTSVAPLVEPGRAKNFEKSVIESVKQKLNRTDTGILSYAAFLYLLDEQIRLSEGHHIAVAVIGMQPAQPVFAHSKSLLAPQQLRLIAKRIEEISGNKGVVAHYEDTDLAWMLPSFSANAALKLADRFSNSLLADPNLTSNLIISIGIAVYPDDAHDMSHLLGAAESARDRARKNGTGTWYTGSTGEI